MSSSNNPDPPNYDQIPVDPVVQALQAQLRAAEEDARHRDEEERRRWEVEARARVETEARRWALAEKECRLWEAEAKEKRAADLDEARRWEERRRARLNELEELKRKVLPAKARKITGAPGEGASDRNRCEAVNVKDGVL